jgi:hypothetical protein
MASGALTPVTNGSSRILVCAAAGPADKPSRKAADSIPLNFASFMDLLPESG